MKNYSAEVYYGFFGKWREISYLCGMEGLVVKNTGSWYVVKTDDSRYVNCKVKGNFRLKGLRTTNPVSVGDRVTIVENADVAFIVEVHQRRNYIIRRASNLSKESHIIASNLDAAMLVVSLVNPLTSTTFIDRFLATAEAYRVPAVIVINKIDLLDEDMREYCDGVRYLYESIGYRVVEVSAAANIGLDEIRTMLHGKTTLLSGNSGVGKSTLINRLVPGAEARTAEVSQTHHTGMHTTTFSEMYELADGGYIIDTPGIKGFGTIDFATEEVAHFFPEIFRISAGCKYGNCTHRHEPGCAVKDALEKHLISESRYASYLSIIDDSADDKYRKPF